MVLSTILPLALLPHLTRSQDQIPNSGFENWIAGEPSGWTTDNIQGFSIPVVRTFASHMGLFALSGEVLPFSRSTRPPFVQTGIRVTHRDAALSGWYEFSTFQGDAFRVDVSMFALGTLIGSGNLALHTVDTVYSQFTVPIHYLFPNITPDSCTIIFQIDGVTPNSQAHSGSTMLVDDIAFSGAVADVHRGAIDPGGFSLEQNYPNPFNPTTNIRYSVGRRAHVIVNVYDILGRKVAGLVDADVQAGNYSVTFDASSLAAGVYFYHLEAGVFSATRRLLVVK